MMIKKNRILLFELLGWILAALFLLALIATATRGFQPFVGKKYSETILSIPISSSILDKLEIRWYAIFILTGIIFAGLMGLHEFDRFKINRDKLINAMLIIVPVSILTSRLYYVIFDPEANYSRFWDVFNLPKGGLSIHGAFLGAMLSILIWAKVTKTNLLMILDAAVIGFLVGQICGRWGNFMNGEANGGPISQGAPILKLLAPFIQEQMKHTYSHPGILVHPTFLYELFFNFLALIALLVYRRMRLFRVGDSFCFYLIYYAILRGLLIEPLRVDPLKIGSVNVNQWPQMISFIVVAIIVFIAIRLYYHFTKKQTPPYYYDLTIYEGRFAESQRNIRLVIFDLDGTLLDSEDIIIKSFHQTLQNKLGLTLSDKEILSFMGPALKETFKKFATPECSVDELITEYTKINKVLHTKANLKLFPKVKYTLFRLRWLNYKLAIVSAKRREMVLLGLELFNLVKYFDVIITSDDTPNSKPDPKGLNIAMEKLAVANYKSIYIGDHPNDILASTNAKVRSCLVAWSAHFDKAVLNKPDIIIGDYSELEGILRRINQ